MPTQPASPAAPRRRIDPPGRTARRLLKSPADGIGEWPPGIRMLCTLGPLKLPQKLTVDIKRFSGLWERRKAGSVQQIPRVISASARSTQHVFHAGRLQCYRTPKSCTRMLRCSDVDGCVIRLPWRWNNAPFGGRKRLADDETMTQPIRFAIAGGLFHSTVRLPLNPLPGISDTE